MSAAAHKGGGMLPSLLRQLFASLRQQPAVDVVVRPVVLASSPVLAAPVLAAPVLALPAPDFRSRARQSSLLDPPASRHNDRIFIIQDFLNRFRHVLARQGITAKDPLLPAFELQGEILLHFTHLTEDLDAELKAHATRTAADLRTGAEQARGLLAEQTRETERMMARAAARVEAAAAETGRQRHDVLTNFSKQTEALLSRTIIHQTRVRIWADRVMAAVFVAVLGGAAHWYGHRSGVDETATAMQAAENQTQRIMLKDGVNAASQWLHYIEWNDPNMVTKSCAPQAFGSSYRLACTITLWNAPPPNDPPVQ